MVKKTSNADTCAHVKLRIIHCPGHSVGTICLYGEGRKMFFSGDYILKKTTLNPFISSFYAKAPLKRCLTR